jgi:hypothetical protein
MPAICTFLEVSEATLLSADHLAACAGSDQEGTDTAPDYAALTTAVAKLI